MIDVEPKSTVVPVAAPVVVVLLITIPPSALALIVIPLAVTVLFIENQAKVEEPSMIALTSNMQNAGISFLNFFIIFLLKKLSFCYFHREKRTFLAIFNVELYIS